MIGVNITVFGKMEATPILSPAVLEGPTLAVALSRKLETVGDDFDVELVSNDGHAFKAHRFVLKMRSPVFCDMFDAVMQQSSETPGPVKLEFPGDAIAELLHFMYSDKLSGPSVLNFKLASDLVIMAGAFDVQRLFQLAEGFLSQAALATKDPCSIASLLIFADAHHAEHLKSTTSALLSRCIKGASKESTAKLAELLSPVLLLEIFASSV
jgi:speckle-type POZ protein